MNCKECRNLLIEYTEELLDATRRVGIEKHLEECPVCRGEAESIQALQDRLAERSRASGPIDFETRVMDRISRERNSGLKTAESAGFLFQTRSLFMKNLKNPMIQVATGLVVVIAVVFGLYSFQNNITFAQVVRPMLDARTISYDIVFGDPADGVGVHDTVIGQKIRRSFSNMETILIIDSENNRMLALNPAFKGAAYVNIQGMVADNNRDFLYFVRNALNEAVKDPNSPVEELGREKLNGMDVVGFQFRSETEEGGEIVIWADSETALPVQIDIRQRGSLFTLCNIRFNVPVDESLVSMEPPAGYTLQNGEVDMKNFSENDFLTVMRIYTEYLGGSFPTELTLAKLLKLVPELGNVIPRMNLKPEEMKEIGNTFARGMMFLQNLTATGADWQYTGSGVRFGEADKAVLRYRLPGDLSTHVIYGDLHVEVTP